MTGRERERRCTEIDTPGTETKQLGIFESDNETLRPGLRSQPGPGRPPPELDRAAVIKLFARGVRGKMKDMR